MTKNIALTLLLTGFLYTGVLAQSTDILNLMPLPQTVIMQNGSFTFSNHFNVAVKGPSGDGLMVAVNRFYHQLGKRTSLIFQQEYITAADNGPGAQLTISFEKNIIPAIGVDEGYTLKISTDHILLNAANNIGVERGLETLYELVTPGKTYFYCPAISINDFPRFKWRGLMIDVARHFIPMEVLKRNVDAMAIVKMNVLHLHLSDDEGFRVESKVYPLLQQKGSDGLYYKQEELKELVNYAHERGIIVVPEFDLPGHCSGILAAYPFLASYPADYKPAKRYKLDTITNLGLGKIMQLISQTPTPTIDPTKESTYTFFDRFFKEMSGIFPDAYLHIGADENNGIAWKQNPAIVAYMKANGMQNTDALQAYFVEKMYQIAKKYNKQLIGWEELFNPALPKDVIVQRWKAAVTDTLSDNIIRHNNRLIVSAGYYLDLFFPAYIHYLNDPVSAGVSTADAAKGILGGEAANWSEIMDGDNEEIRVWPRAAAIAERFWSAANVRDVDDMYRRLWPLDNELNDRAIEENSRYIKLLSRWVNYTDLNPVLTLCNVYTPVKGYKRLMGNMLSPAPVHPNLASPLVTMADAVHSDSETGWYFRKLVADYLDKHTPADLVRLKAQLQKWKDNKADFNASAVNSPYLQQITDLSDDLSNAAGIALQALNNEGSKDEQLKQLEALEKPSHEVQLVILPAIEALVTGTLKPEPTAYPMF